jgi:hypothetical protein
MAFLFALLFALFVVALSACVMGLGLLAVAAIFGTIRNDRNSNKIGRDRRALSPAVAFRHPLNDARPPLPAAVVSRSVPSWPRF